MGLFALYVLVAFLSTCSANPIVPSPAASHGIPELFDPALQECPVTDCEVLVELLTCPPSEREIQIIRVGGHDCPGCPTCRGSHQGQVDIPHPGPGDIPQPGRGDIPQPSRGDTPATPPTTTPASQAPTSTVSTPVPVTGPSSSSSSTPLSTTDKASSTSASGSSSTTTSTTTTGTSSTGSTRLGETSTASVDVTDGRSEAAEPGVGRRGDKGGREGGEVENRTAGFPEAPAGEKGPGSREEEAIIRALNMLRAWSRDGRLGSMLQRVLGLPPVVPPGIPSSPLGTRYVSRPAMDFPEEVPPLELGCPTLDCEAIEESLACPESDREATTLTTGSGLRCPGCRRCKPKLSRMRRPIVSHFPFGGCPRLDCNRIEAALRCNSYNRELEYFTLSSGKRCPGCLKCIVIDESRDYDSFELIDASRDLGESRDRPSAPIRSERLPVVQAGRRFDCPMIDCDDIEASLACDVTEREVEYFVTPSGQQCPGCRKCPIAHARGRMGPEDDQPEGMQGNPACPSLDCQVVEDSLACTEDQREAVTFQTPHGITCTGCRRCKAGTTEGQDRSSTEEGTSEIERDIIEPEIAPSVEASERDTGPAPSSEEYESEGHLPPPPYPPSLPACPLLDCDVIDEGLTCPPEEREQDYYVTRSGARCPGCQKCLEASLPVPPMLPQDELPSDPRDLPLPGMQCPMLDCSDLEDDLSCPESQRRVVYFTSQTGALCPGCRECPPSPVPSLPSSLPPGCPLMDCVSQEADLPCPPSQRKWTTFRIGSGQICPGCNRCVR